MFFVARRCNEIRHAGDDASEAERRIPLQGDRVKRCTLPGFALLMLVAASPLLARVTQMTLYTASSEPFTVYVAGPKEARKGVVLVHDWFGVSPFYTEAAERLAKQGYRVVAVDLYGGHHATTHEEAGKLLESLRDETAAREIDGAIQSLSDGGRIVAVMGFSMGARHALAAALRNGTVRATVLWYGETIKDAEQLRHLAGPALLIAGSRDGQSAAEDSAAFSKAADRAGVGAEVYVYPGADHAFAQPLFNRGKTYDPVAAGAAWLLSEDFLKRRLVAP
jgi:carboxymethylenebutenolidase